MPLVLLYVAKSLAFIVMMKITLQIDILIGVKYNCGPLNKNLK